MWLGRDYWAAGEGTVWPGGTWTEAAIRLWGKVGEQCPGETGLGKHVTSSSYWKSPGWPEAGLRALSLSKGSIPSLAPLGPCLTHRSFGSPEVFRSKCSFQEGLHSTCRNTVNMAWRGPGFWACPEHYNFFFPFSGNIFVLYSFIYTWTVCQLKTWLCRVEMPALPNLKSGCASESFR